MTWLVPRIVWVFAEYSVTCKFCHLLVPGPMHYQVSPVLWKNCQSKEEDDDDDDDDDDDERFFFINIR